MKATTIEGATRILGAPKGWNAGRDGECVGLHGATVTTGWTGMSPKTAPRN